MEAEKHIEREKLGKRSEITSKEGLQIGAKRNRRTSVLTRLGWTIQFTFPSFGIELQFPEFKAAL